MLVQQILTDARRELIETTGVFWSDAELLRHYNKGELNYVNKTRILEDEAQLSLVAGQAIYPLPQNWLSAKAVFLKLVNTDGTFRWKRLNPSNLEKVSQEAPNFLDTTTTERQGEPDRYWIWGRSLRLDRAPNSEFATSLWLFYKSKPIPVTDPATQSINIDDSLSEALTSYILWKAWKKEKETDLADEAQLEYKEWVAEGRKWVKKQSGDQRWKIDIESPIGFYSGSSSQNPLEL